MKYNILYYLYYTILEYKIEIVGYKEMKNENEMKNFYISILYFIYFSHAK